MTLQISEFLGRARGTSSDPPTLYLLGAGGWYRNEGAPPPQPGRHVEVAKALKAMKQQERAKYDHYRDEAARAGIDIEQCPPPDGQACDCSGFVTWALKLPRDRAPREGRQGWLKTDTIHADALGPQDLFVRLDSDETPGTAEPGAMLVYGRCAGHEVGHIAIVTEINATGRPTRIIHCAPENYLEAPLAGRERNAIRETDVAPFFTFDDARHVIVVSCKLLTP